jgi:hypothetical protein
MAVKARSLGEPILDHKGRDEGDVREMLFSLGYDVTDSVTLRTKYAYSIVREQINQFLPKDGLLYVVARLTSDTLLLAASMAGAEIAVYKAKIIGTPRNRPDTGEL